MNSIGNLKIIIHSLTYCAGFWIWYNWRTESGCL